MLIRKAKINEIDTLMEIFAAARSFMRQTGNMNQWTNGYPSHELIKNNIEAGKLYACIEEESDIPLGVFYFSIEKEPTYDIIYEGQWLNDEPYGVVHRLASNGKIKGLAARCLEWCFDRHKNIRIDTHRENTVMQRILENNGYTRCGIIHLADGDERVAFQKTAL